MFSTSSISSATVFAIIFPLFCYLIPSSPVLLVQAGCLPVLSFFLWLIAGYPEHSYQRVTWLEQGAAFISAESWATATWMIGFSPLSSLGMLLCISQILSVSATFNFCSGFFFSKVGTAVKQCSNGTLEHIIIVAGLRYISHAHLCWGGSFSSATSLLILKWAAPYFSFPKPQWLFLLLQFSPYSMGFNFQRFTIVNVI